jgi:hypothetical protein
MSSMSTTSKLFFYEEGTQSSLQRGNRYVPVKYVGTGATIPYCPSELVSLYSSTRTPSSPATFRSVYLCGIICICIYSNYCSRTHLERVHLVRRRRKPHCLHMVRTTIRSTCVCSRLPDARRQVHPGSRMRCTVPVHEQLCDVSSVPWTEGRKCETNPAVLYRLFVCFLVGFVQCYDHVRM